ncbi:MAG TPA: EAL domain-containing protein [Candidatus Blautia excrementipullorum]|nr:EAL domain-containing protein [Candidatus Blautia excrementipullorum]
MQKIEFNKPKELLRTILATDGLSFCEYIFTEDILVLYDHSLCVKRTIPEFLNYIKTSSVFHPEDQWKLRRFFQERSKGEIEIHVEKNNVLTRQLLQVYPLEGIDHSSRFLFIIRDVTWKKDREALLEIRAMRDSLTMLYNHFFGRDLINEYLSTKDPYASCGLMVIDLDYFKYANDTYGHLFGDQVLVAFARLLTSMFEEKDILIRAGGDEFVVFLKDISHTALVKKSMQLINAARKLTFKDKGYSVTCSAGVCFLAENISGYSYDQLFENADWALYRAKENGRNRYAFCDSLQRYELSEKEPLQDDSIDIRYLHNDIISTAFEIFEKTSNFTMAVELLMKVIGYRFQLDRITIIRTDIKEKSTSRQYQWCSQYAPEVLTSPEDFTKEDFLTLFQSYDDNLTTVLQYDNMGMYSPGGAALLMQGGAKTVLYAAMYCEGKYTGAISYVVCREKRFWSKQNRKELSEVTKIISAHLSRTQSDARELQSQLSWTEYDSLTGLISFSRFRIEAEHLIVGNYATSHAMIYSDFESFKYFNQKCGYSVGDQLLKEYSNFFIEKLENVEPAAFTRVISDQFLMLVPYADKEELIEKTKRFNQEFIQQQAGKFQGARLRIRIGVYFIEPGCVSASFAIDAANYARKQVPHHTPVSIRIYDEELKHKQELENEIINGIDEAFQEHRFQIYLQPKISLATGKVVGAEALVRWITREGTVLTPDAFVPLCESSGRIEELDFYVFERVAEFLARNQKLGRKQVPISVNASILHASDPFAVQKYLNILEKYHIDPKYTEIELTETATVDEYEKARRWFRELRKAGIRTAMDDFGAGYSVLNSVIDIPVDTVKLDRAFIRNCEVGPRGIFFFQKLVDMIRGLGYHVVCEGVETETQFNMLKETDCEEVQGYLFSRPLSLSDYEEYVYHVGETQSAGDSA